MAPSPVLDSILLNILSRYPLSNAKVLDMLKASQRNDNYLIEDVSGQRYVLRRYRRNNQETRVRFQLSFQQYLENSGFPTSKVVKTVSDEVLVLEEDSPWALFPFIEGSEYDFGRVQQVVEAARRLAQFHTIADGFQGREVVHDISRMPNWWTDAEREIHMLGKFFAGMGVDNEINCIRDYVIELTNEWPSERNSDLGLAWVHGDYHGRNMVFVGDEMRGLFDFDVIHRGPRIEDIYRAIFMFGRQHRGSSIIRSNVAQSFLEEYTRNIELSQLELEALPIFAVLDSIPFESYFTMLKRDNEDPVSYLRSFVETMRAMHSEMKRLEPIFKG